MLRTLKYFEWIIKQLLNLAFACCDELCRSQMMLSCLDLHYSSHPTQLHSVIAQYIMTKCVETTGFKYYARYRVTAGFDHYGGQ